MYRRNKSTQSMEIMPDLETRLQHKGNALSDGLQFMAYGAQAIAQVQ